MYVVSNTILSNPEPTESISADEFTVTDNSMVDAPDVQGVEISPKSNSSERTTDNLALEPSNASNSNQTSEPSSTSRDSPSLSSRDGTPKFTAEQTPIDHSLSTVTNCVSGSIPEGSLDIAANWEVGESRLIELARQETYMRNGRPKSTLTSSTLVHSDHCFGCD